MEDFFNRVRKNLKLRSKWAQAANVDAFRLYDRDIPQYPFVADRYGDWLVVGSFARDPELFEILQTPDSQQALASAAQVQAGKVVLRQRERKRGDDQYEKLLSEPKTLVVREHGLSFEVDLAQYLDVGLFLDHRPLRRFLQGEVSKSEAGFADPWVAGKSCLNLFCYTGTVSVAMVRGGARIVVSVDMSHTYLDWYLRNLRLNGCVGLKVEELRGQTLKQGKDLMPPDQATSVALRADVTAWLRQWPGGDPDARPRFDFIFVDPPSFSNSKKMAGTFDVQRDHPWLLRQCAQMLTPEGVLLFSNNRVGFKLADGVLSEHKRADVSAITHGCDFSQRTVHHGFAFSRSDAALNAFVGMFRKMAPASSR